LRGRDQRKAGSCRWGGLERHKSCQNIRDARSWESDEKKGPTIYRGREIGPSPIKRTPVTRGAKKEGLRGLKSGLTTKITKRRRREKEMGTTASEEKAEEARERTSSGRGTEKKFHKIPALCGFAVKGGPDDRSTVRL